MTSLTTTCQRIEYERPTAIKTVAARLSKSVAALTVAVATILALAGPSAAAPYGTTSPTVAVSRTSPGEHGSFLFTFTGAHPGDTIVIVIHSRPRTLGTYIADANGYVAATVRAPYGFHGLHNIVGTDVQTNLSGTAQIRIGTMVTPEQTPFVSRWVADASVVGVGVLALVLLGGGGMLVFFGKRRRRSEEQHA